jgi:Holliday junction resolvase RusA-like endonuclease
MRQELWLPWPPTANTMFAMRGYRRFVSPKYAEWKDLVAAHLKDQRPVKMDCSVNIHISLSAPTKRKWDIDNRVKPIIDVLVTHGIIEDDHSGIVRRITVEVSNDELPGATVWLEEVEIELTDEGKAAIEEFDNQYLPNGTEGQ